MGVAVAVTTLLLVATYVRVFLLVLPTTTHAAAQNNAYLELIATFCRAPLSDSSYRCWNQLTLCITWGLDFGRSNVFGLGDFSCKTNIQVY